MIYYILEINISYIDEKQIVAYIMLITTLLAVKYGTMETQPWLIHLTSPPCQLSSIVMVECRWVVLIYKSLIFCSFLNIERLQTSTCCLSESKHTFNLHVE